MENKNKDQLKKFTFFVTQEYKDSPQDNIFPSLNDIAINQAVYIEPNFYFVSKSEKLIYSYSRSENNEKDYSITSAFKPFTHDLYELVRVYFQGQNYLVAYGSDFDEQNEEKRTTFIKIYEVQYLLQLQQENLEHNVLQIENVSPKRKIQIGKSGQPLKDFGSFAISEDLTQLAFGLFDGQIWQYKCKTGHNFLTTGSEPKLETVQADVRIIKTLFFSKYDNQYNLYFTTEESVFIKLENNKIKKLDNQGGNLFDINPAGKLIGCTQNDTLHIKSYDPYTNRPKTWNYEAEKQVIHSFKNNYIIMLCLKKDSNEQQFIVYDLINQYIAYYKDPIRNVKLIIPTYNQGTQSECIHVIALNQKGEISIFKLTENENAFKMETFFKRSYFDVAYRFAQNQDSDPALLAEISKLHADFRYQKGQHDLAIAEYIKTIDYVEPSYVIKKFLDVQHIEYLIQYLEQIHKQKSADKHHTALLLNCYVKQKSINKLQEFLKESNFESDLFDIETAIKVCRELEHYKLALQLSEQKKQHEYYLQILTEDQNQYLEAIEYIKKKIEVNQKERYILDIGQILMKHEPEATLKLIKNIVHLSIIAYNYTQRAKSGNSSANLKPPTAEEKEVFIDLNINERDQENLRKIIFRRPDEFLHLFVVEPQKLKEYLEFLTGNFKDFPNEKAIYHRLFEYYLEEYHNSLNKNDEDRQQMDIGTIVPIQRIMSILQNLQNQDSDKKFDKNHLLVLFKMYNFEKGIIYLCEQMNLLEELINYYITNNKTNEIIETCKKYGELETNLWVQALKHFSKPNNSEEMQSQLPHILEHISNIPSLSPLLILNILSKNGNIQLKLVKDYFIKKLEQDRKAIERDRNDVERNQDKAEKFREEYKKLKTEAKIFQSTKCEECGSSFQQQEQVTLNFMCGHQFCNDCVQNHIMNRDFTGNQCPLCYRNFNKVIETKQALEEKNVIQKRFFDQMESKNNKFDVITEFLAKGLFSQQQEPEF